MTKKSLVVFPILFALLIGAVGVFAQTSTPTTSTSTASTDKLACMKAAVEKRENSLLAAFDTFTQKVRTARETRKTDLLAAWSIQDKKERHTAIKTAVNKYRQSVKTAKSEWKQSRNTSWKQFQHDAKNCRMTGHELENQNLDQE